jgi:5'-nucleotidase
VSPRGLRILHTNDLHGALSQAKLDQFLPHRGSHDLWIDSGDAIKSGNLSIPLRPEPVWDLFRQGGLSAFCPGNRESHIWPQGVEGKFRGCQVPVLCSSWRDKSGRLLWEDGLVLTAAGLKVGIFGVMVPIVTKRMKTQAASAYLWDSPVEAASRTVALLRPQCDVLIAVTHIGLTWDRRLAEQVPGLNLILGGHSHSILKEPEYVGKTPIVQGGSHGRWWGSCTLSQTGELVEHVLHPWGE